MCLYSVNTNPPPTEGKGWKVFLNRTDWETNKWISLWGLKLIPRPPRRSFAFPYFNPQVEPVEIGHWNIRHSTLCYPLITTTGEKYEPGFHLFVNKKDAKRWRQVYGLLGTSVKKVEYKDAFIIGKSRLPILYRDEYKEFLADCIVARQIRII